MKVIIALYIVLLSSTSIALKSLSKRAGNLEWACVTATLVDYISPHGMRANTEGRSIVIVMAILSQGV